MWAGSGGGFMGLRVWWKKKQGGCTVWKRSLRAFLNLPLVIFRCWLLSDHIIWRGRFQWATHGRWGLEVRTQDLVKRKRPGREQRLLKKILDPSSLELALGMSPPSFKKPRSAIQCALSPWVYTHCVLWAVINYPITHCTAKYKHPDKTHRHTAVVDVLTDLFHCPEGMLQLKCCGRIVFLPCLFRGWVFSIFGGCLLTSGVGMYVWLGIFQLIGGDISSNAKMSQTNPACQNSDRNPNISAWIRMQVG